MPKCLICGYASRSLQPHLKHKHQLKVSEYREVYGEEALVYDYNPADRLKKWAEENPEDYLRKQSEAGRKGAEKLNEYLSENPEIRSEIARKGGQVVSGRNLQEWRSKVGSSVVSECCARAGRLSSISKGHDYMARVALKNNRYCKYPYQSDKFSINKVFASQWEVNFIKVCEICESIKSLVHEPFGISYEREGKSHKYYPDFLVNDSVIVEIKPEGRCNEEDVKIKARAAQDYCKLNPKYTYIILTEKSLYSLRSGEITTSAQQELIRLLMI